jgi:hypothetical protein
MTSTYPGLAPNIGDPARTQLAVSAAVNRINSGRINVTAALTLNTSSTSTVLNDNRINAQSYIALMPLSANAATVHGSIWYAAPSIGTVTLHHASNAATDLHYGVLIIG